MRLNHNHVAYSNNSKDSMWRSLDIGDHKSRGSNELPIRVPKRKEVVLISPAQSQICVTKGIGIAALESLALLRSQPTNLDELH